ncbi:hypothetical protein, partial [Paraburkholderia sp. SIMBA_027]|uniref:hypothetical protein n=1 Tax=Paraburkholderia sp. SIMBA_027 TaxID=3085770 RepID=UPI00397A92F1
MSGKLAGMVFDSYPEGGGNLLRGAFVPQNGVFTTEQSDADARTDNRSLDACERCGLPYAR